MFSKLSLVVLVLIGLVHTTVAQIAEGPGICDDSFGGMIPLACDVDDGTVPQEKQKVEISTELFDMKTVLHCRGEKAAAFACLGPGPADDTIGIWIGSDDGTLDFEANGASICASFFYISGAATRFKTVCEGEDFKVDHKIEITRYTASPSSSPSAYPTLSPTPTAAAF